MIETIGACKFCGRVKVITASTAVDQEHADESATNMCSCEKAFRASLVQQAAKVMEKALGEDSAADGFKVLSKDIHTAAMEIYAGVVSGEIVKASIDTGSDVIRIRDSAQGVKAERIRKVIKKF